MGRCGCEGTTCGCKVVGDGGIIVTGAGTAANPYRVSGSLGMQVTDTASINLTMLGTGSQSDPWLLSADFAGRLDDLLDVDTSGGTTGEVLARQADGTYALVPPATTAPGLIATGNGLEGDGSSGDPLNARLGSLSGLQIASDGLKIAPYTVTDEANLDSTFGALPPGSLVSDTDGTRVWVRSLSGWVELVEDTGTITTISGYITAASGWTVNAFRARRRNGIVQVNITATRSANTVPTHPDGNINASQIATITAPIFRPAINSSAPGGFSESTMAQSRVLTSGEVWIEQVAPAETTPAGTQLLLSATYIGIGA